MTSRQYEIVKCFLLMGNSARRISQAFKAPYADVVLCEGTATYEQFSNQRTTNDLNSLFGFGGI